jgi:hypothetical protein
MNAVTLDLEQLKFPICAIVQLAIEPPRPDFAGRPIRPLQQVTLRPDKVLGDLIRLGETRGDEARCWIAAEHVAVVKILGRVKCAGDPANEQAEWVQDQEPEALAA